MKARFASGRVASGLAVLLLAAGSMPAPGATGSLHAPLVPDIEGGFAIHTSDRSAPLRVDHEAGTVSIPATVQAEAFRRSTPPDDRYHALVHRDGSAAGKSLFLTEVPDTVVARTLRELGADDGGGVPLSAWSLRRLPFLPQPNRRVKGSLVQVSVTWEGADRPYAIEELVHDDGDRGIEVRFGGNEEHDEHWDSGCILCLFSCPGGVLSNGAYSIRDHQRGVTSFDPGSILPPDGTPVTITLALAGP